MRSYIPVRGLTVMVCTLAVVVLAPASALAVGTATLNLKAAGAAGLRNQGVKVSAVKPATLRSNKLTLNVSGGAVGDSATLATTGDLVFKKGKRKVTIKTIRVSIGTDTSVSGRLDGKQMTIFKVTAASSAKVVNQTAGAASLSGGKLSLTASAGKAIKKKLRLKKTVRASFGTIAASAKLTASATSNGQPAGPEATVFSRPATAVDITSSTIAWRVRQSWVDYVLGDGGSVNGIGGATGATYDWNIPWRAGGWYDPVSKTADVFGAGGLQFVIPNRFDLQTYDPEIELNGAASRGIFKFGGGKRGVLVNLALSTPTVNGNSYTYPAMPATMAEDGFSVFTYPTGSEFGTFAVSFTTL